MEKLKRKRNEDEYCSVLAAFITVCSGRIDPVKLENEEASAAVAGDTDSVATILLL